MALNASDVNPGDDILAAHNNALIDDIQTHPHDGVDTVQIATAGIENDAADKDKINSDVAGSGLEQDGDGSLELEEYTAGDILIHTGIANSSAADVYEKKAEVGLPRNGTLRIKFNLWKGVGGTTAYARIYRNGGAVGTERLTAAAAPGVEFSEDIAGWSKGDLLQIYMKKLGATTSNINAMTLYVNTYIEEVSTTGL